MGARAKKLEDTVPGTRTLGLSRKVRTEVTPLFSREQRLPLEPLLREMIRKKKRSIIALKTTSRNTRGVRDTHSLGFREAFTLTKGNTYQLALLEGVSSNW